MLILKIVVVIILLFSLLYLLLPTGNFVHELLMLPFWSWKLSRLPKGNYIERKLFYGAHARQYLLFFQPRYSDTNGQVVVYFHGGGWQFGSPEMFRPNAQALIDQGYTVFMPSHRRIPLFNWRHLIEDARSALVTIKGVMESNGLHGNKIILGGTSSGGHLAALLAFEKSIQEKPKSGQLEISGLFLFGAVLHLKGMRHSPPVWFLAGNRNGADFNYADPINCLGPPVSFPVLILHGTQDGLVEFKSVLEFVQKFEKTPGGQLEFTALHDGIHTDAASWGFPGHPANLAFFEWLQKLERESSAN